MTTTLIHAPCVQRLSARVPGRGGEVAVAAALHDVLRRAQVREEDALGPVRGRGPLTPLLREAAVLACGPRRRYRGVGGHVTRDTWRHVHPGHNFMSIETTSTSNHPITSYDHDI